LDASGAAIVTGASRGIGRGVALELATRGFDVLATMRDPADGASLPAEAKERGGRLTVEGLDVCAPDYFPFPASLRVLVNNAGVDGPHLPLEHHDVDDWRRLFETNVFGLVAVTQAALPALRAAGESVVCNVTSSSLLVPVPFFAAYRASKAAVAALGESLRIELTPFGGRVLEVQPGAIATDMLADSDQPLAAEQHGAYRAMAERFTERRQNTQDSTPVEHAARSIVDAILDDDALLRVTCDPMGEGLATAREAMGDEDFLRAMQRGFDPNGESG